MLNATTKFKQEWYNGILPKLCFADITLEDGTELNLTNIQIWAGGFSTDNAVSEDDSFTALGSAIIGSASIIINNIDETYSDYDFMNASVILYVGLDLESNNQVEQIKVGTYHVDNPHYNGATITLDLLDNMEQFDRPYTTSLTYPATLDEIVHDACTKCGVAFSNLSENFPNYDYEVAEKPSGEDTTYREVLSWAAMIAGCFCKCDVNGKLELKWFDISTLEDWEDSITDGGTFSPWNNPSSIDGGHFNPWDTGAVLDGGSFTDFPTVHYISALYSQDICVDDTIITGVRILVRTDSDDEDEAIKEFVEDNVLLDVSDYIIEISDNPFITVDTAQDVLDYLASQLIGVKFRKLSVSHKSNPIIEAGDIAVVIDRKARQYPTLITHVSFTIGSSQTLICGSETPARNKSTRFGNDVKNFVAGRKELLKERNSWQAAEADLADKIATANGLYTTDVQTSSGVIHYLHNKGPNGEDDPTHAGLDASDIRIMISDVGITMTANGTDPQPIWYGLTVDGTFLANIINTISLFFDYAHGGTLTLGGQDNVNGLLRMLSASGVEVGKWYNGGLQTKSLTADDYIYVKGNSASYFYLPLAKSVASTGNNYIQISDGGFKIRAIAAYEVAGVTGIKDTLMEFGTDTSEYNTGNNKPAIKISNGNDKIDLLLCRINLVDNGVGTKFSIKSFTDSDTGAGFGVTRSGAKTYINTIDSQIAGDLTVTGGLYVQGTKPRLVDTEDYGKRLLYCYETPTPMFGDIGNGIIGEDGSCYIALDPVFAETISTSQYQVFLQKYGEGECYVSKRTSSYFIVTGTPNLEFGWEIKAKQLGYEERRIDNPINTSYIEGNTINYGGVANNYITELNKGRIGG